MSVNSTPAKAVAPPRSGVRLGRFLFKSRDYTPVPLVAVGAFLATPSLGTILVGLAIMAFGEAFRFWGVSYIGSVSRTRGNNTGNLIRSGPFGRVRNPLYVGNFFLSLGAVLMTGLWWIVPIYIAMFAFQYHFIVIYEEDNLWRKFGHEYDEFCSVVPRWLPLGPGPLPGEQRDPDIQKALKSEVSTFAAIAGIVALFLLKFWLLPETTVWSWIFG